MISLHISEDIIKRHIKYVCNSDICEALESLSKEVFVNNLSKVWKEGEVKEHEELVEFLINQIRELEGIKDINQINQFKKNIFIAEPNELNEKIRYIQVNFSKVSEKFKSKDEISDELPNSYSNYFLEAFGYTKFSATEIQQVYKEELDEFKTINRGYLDGFLVENRVDKANRYYQQEDLKGLIEELNKRIIGIFKSTVKDVELKKIVENMMLEIVYLQDKGLTSKELWINEIIEIIKITRERLSVREANMVINLSTYEQRYSGLESWGAYDFVMELGLKVCPYCNRNYITPIYSQEGKMRGDLDHFYPKSRYPYLSMSIYNLVPCCKSCNSSLKGTKEFSYNKNINPYEGGLEELMKFTYIPNSYDSFYYDDTVKVALAYSKHIDNNLKARSENNNSIFNIYNLYQYHQDTVKRLIKKRIIYNKVYIEDILKQYGNLFSGKEEVVRLMLDNCDIKEAKNIPLGKLVRDIIEELDFD